MAPSNQRRVLVVGGSFAGLCVARDLKKHFQVTIVDAKEFFEYTPGILRAYVKPSHFDALSFTLQPVIERKMGCKYIWGEVTELNGPEKTAKIVPMFVKEEETIGFDYCIIASGCNFGPFHPWGQSLWFPTVHAKARPAGDWPHLDERFIEGRRRHILEEYVSIQRLAEKNSSVLVVGAGFIGVEWVTELQHFFPTLDLTIIDFLPLPLGPLPANAAIYCKDYMDEHNIKQFYQKKYEPTDAFFETIGFKGKRPDKQYVCVGVKASNYFMPIETLSEGGPFGGKWILMDQTLAVKTREGKRWSVDAKGNGVVYAVGDCNYGCIDIPGEKDINKWPIPPIPKISYPGEEEALIASTNIHKIDMATYHGKTRDFWCKPLKPANMHWPWGAGMFATSLGPHDACFVLGANWVKNSGYMCVWGYLCAIQKEFIETSKTDECRMGIIGRCIWHFVHHTPLHLWGGGPLMGYSPSWF